MHAGSVSSSRSTPTQAQIFIWGCPHRAVLAACGGCALPASPRSRARPFGPARGMGEAVSALSVETQSPERVISVVPRSSLIFHDVTVSARAPFLDTSQKRRGSSRVGAQLHSATHYHRLQHCSCDRGAVVGAIAVDARPFATKWSCVRNSDCAFDPLRQVHDTNHPWASPRSLPISMRADSRRAARPLCAAP